MRFIECRLEKEINKNFIQVPTISIDGLLPSEYRHDQNE
jgi:hypothetical protein